MNERTPAPVSSLAQALCDALPQTQCTRCGYPDCASYAQAIATGQAEVNQCPPGGQAGVERLAHLMHRTAPALSASHGAEGPRHLAVIDEALCIGCTLCISACPTDAIMGTNKRMHTVIAPACTGCGLCLPVCPVDCIDFPIATENRTGWAAWTPEQAQTARLRYKARSQRLTACAAAPEAAEPAAAASQLPTLAAPDRKQAILQAALAKAKQQHHT